MKADHLRTVRTRRNTRIYVNNRNNKPIAEDEDVMRDVIVVEGIEQFVQLRLEILAVIDKLTPIEVKLLCYMSLNSIFNKNLFHHNSISLKEMSAKTGVHPQTIKTNLASMVEKKFVVREQRGVYLINPKYAWKGGKEERVKCLKHLFEICLDCK
jgi:hypothetical protein